MGVSMGVAEVGRAALVCAAAMLAAARLFLLLVPLLAAPLQQNQLSGFVNYLNRFGYLGTAEPSLKELDHATRLFQEVSGLEETGGIDEATLDATRRVRCAHRDARKQNSRSKRFALASSSRWDRNHFTSQYDLTLKWHVSHYTKDIKEKVVRQTIKDAFQLWKEQSNLRTQSHHNVQLNFVEVNSKSDADINILWAEGEHGDAYPFDGSRNNNDNILAHTFFPGHSKPLNGDIHFDAAEHWDVSLDSTRTSDRRFFPYVLAHEIGHALGLQHSKKTNALMNPFYKDIPIDQINLDIDDKCGINWNYVGPSNFCLFVWLMSEIVPFHRNGSFLHTKHIMKSKERLAHAKKVLKSTRIPRCLQNNELQGVTERRLHRQLHFTHADAKKYSEVVCNFLIGLHFYRGRSDYSPSENVEKEYHGVSREVHEFSPQSATAMRRLTREAESLQEHGQSSVFDPYYFNKNFFDDFFSEYVSYVDKLRE